jgi:hypothetical protein
VDGRGGDPPLRPCLPRPEREAKGVAILEFHRYRKAYPRTLFDKAHAWLAADHLDNWAPVDSLCPEVVGALRGDRFFSVAA